MSDDHFYDLGSPTIVTFEEMGTWVSVWLEHYLVGKGSSPDDSFRKLIVAIITHASKYVESGKKPVTPEAIFADIEKAPPEYWAMWNAGEAFKASSENPKECS